METPVFNFGYVVQPPVVKQVFQATGLMPPPSALQCLEGGIRTAEDGLNCMCSYLWGTPVILSAYTRWWNNSSGLEPGIDPPDAPSNAPAQSDIRNFGVYFNANTKASLSLLPCLSLITFAE